MLKAHCNVTDSLRLKRRLTTTQLQPELPSLTIATTQRSNIADARRACLLNYAEQRQQQ